MKEPGETSDQKGIDHIIDPKLDLGFKDEITKVLNIGLLCASLLPINRPSWLLVLTLPFGTLFIELFFILTIIWLGRFYHVFGFLLVVLLLLVTVCAEVSVVLTYMHLCVEDWRWWWKSFFASGSVALYVFLHSVNYLIFDLRSLSGLVSSILYLGYSLIMAVAILLSTGTVGFPVSLIFVHYLFSSVKID